MNINYLQGLLTGTFAGGAWAALCAESFVASALLTITFALWLRWDRVKGYSVMAVELDPPDAR